MWLQGLMLTCARLDAPPAAQPVGGSAGAPGAAPRVPGLRWPCECLQHWAGGASCSARGGWGAADLGFRSQQSKAPAVAALTLACCLHLPRLQANLQHAMSFSIDGPACQLLARALRCVDIDKVQVQGRRAAAIAGSSFRRDRRCDCPPLLAHSLLRAGAARVGGGGEADDDVGAQVGEAVDRQGCGFGVRA